MQVRRAVQHDAAVPGVLTTIGTRSRVTHLVPVTVGETQTVDATTSAPVTEVVGPDVLVTRAPATGPLTLDEPGEYWLALEPESTLEYVYDQLGPDKLEMMTPPSFWEGNISWALLVVPPDGQGSMDLTLTKTSQEP